MHKATLFQHSIKISLLLLIPIAIYCIPLESWLTGRSICLFKFLLGEECWGCGITRAVVLAMRGDFATSLEHHRAVAVVLPILLYWWVKLLYKEIASIFNK